MLTKDLSWLITKLIAKESVKKVTGERDPRDNSYIRFFNFIASRGVFITLVRKILGPQKVVVVIESRTATCNLPYTHLLLILWQCPFLDRFISSNITAIAFLILVDEFRGVLVWAFCMRDYSFVVAISGFISAQLMIPTTHNLFFRHGDRTLSFNDLQNTHKVTAQPH